MTAGGFIGREPELAILRQGLLAARAGTGSMLLVAGEVGIGKTRFAQEAVARAKADGCFTAWGGCLEEEGAPPYWAWIQALRDIARVRPEVSLPTLSDTRGATNPFQVCG